MGRVLARFFSAYWVGMRLDARYGSGVLADPGGHTVLGHVIGGYEGWGEHPGQHFKQVTAHYPHSTFREDLLATLPIVDVGSEKTFETIPLENGDWVSKLGRYKSYGPFYSETVTAVADLVKFHTLVTFGEEWSKWNHIYFVREVDWDDETDDGVRMTPEHRTQLSYPFIIGVNDAEEIPDALSDFSAWLVKGYFATKLF